MNNPIVHIKWPNGKSSIARHGDDWLKLATEVGIDIPTGCLGGSCGACEIEVNGRVIRACVEEVASSRAEVLKVGFASDPYWDRQA